MVDYSIDAYTPKEIAKRVENAAISKTTNEPIKVFVLALLAGAFIAMGAAFFTLVTYNSDFHPGMLRLVGGLVFCLGLILVVVAGAELFTGNNLIVMAYVDKKVTLNQLIQNWLIVFLGNFIGALGVAVLMTLSRHWLLDGGALGVKAVAIAQTKVNYDFIQAFSLGVGCNILVCMAVWLSFAGHSATDKIIAIIFPITAFVALGFEHSVANMYFIPSAMLIENFHPEVIELYWTQNPTADIGNISFYGLFFKNLLPVTLGNLLGGSVFVGIVYWFIYLKE